MLALASTLIVPSSYADGRVSWDQRGLSNGVDMITATANIVGGRQDTANQFCHSFIFKFGDGTTGSGIPQGRTIVTAYLRLRSNNDNTVLDTNVPPIHTLAYVWLAVENNLDPTKQGKAMTPANPDRFQNSAHTPSSEAIAASPWQRLTAQSESATYFGRSGVTHSGTLSSTNVGPRDTTALIYQAFRSNDGTGTITPWPLTSWVVTHDFAPALNALVQDPSWSGDLQYVNVFMFVANTEAQGATFGVGNLGARTYVNGQNGVDTPIAANAGGQINMAESAFPPQLWVTHQSADPYEELDLASPSLPSTLGGQAYLTGRQPVNVVRGVRWDQSATGGVIPKVSAGAGDTPIWDMEAHNPQSAAWAATGGAPFDSKVKHVDSTRMPSGTALILEGYAGKQCTFWMRPAIWPHETTADWNMEAYSLRFYYQFAEESLPGAFWDCIAFHRAPGTSRPDGTDFVWDIRCRGGDTHFVSGEGTLFDHGEPQIGGYQEGVLPSYRQILSDWQYPYTMSPHPSAWRWEIQVDQNRNPKIRIRLYNTATATTAYRTWELNPSFDVSMGYLRFGKIEPNYLPICYYGDFELHPNYDLSGEFEDPVRTTTGHPYVTPTWTWFEWDGAVAKPLEDLGTITAVSGGGVPTLDHEPLTYENDQRDVYNPVGYTKTHSNVAYSAGACVLDRYRPNGTTGVPLPCAVYIHGGFWQGGDKNEPQLGLIDLFTSLGWEFVSINYTLSRGPFSTAYPAWNPASDTARHPSHIVQAKLAVKYMAAQTTGTYPVDPSRMITLGHSAGAYLAGAVGYSRGLGGGGGPLYNPVGLGGLNLTVSNTTFGGTTGAVDPVVMGVLMLTAPVDLPMACAYDPSVEWPLAGVDGNIRLTTKCYLGLPNNVAFDARGTELWRYVRDNPAAMPSTYYQQGGSDFLVHWRHWELLKEDLDAKGLLYQHRFNRAVTHDNAKKEFDVVDIRDWVESL